MSFKQKKLLNWEQKIKKKFDSKGQNNFRVNRENEIFLHGKLSRKNSC